MNHRALLAGKFKILLLALSLLILYPRPYAIAEPLEPAAASPKALTAQLKESLPNTRKSCVGIDLGGSASGVIVSPDGLILTAAHIFRSYKEKNPVKVVLHDEQVAEAELLGFNRETDIALLRITTPSKKPWPSCTLAGGAPLTGSFCFTVAHPSGYLEGRPAQVRIGRITSHSMLRGKPHLLTADCKIQPGDSGGPLFSMDGKLIGLDSSAATLLDFNLFPAIDQYYLDQARLLSGERWGSDELAPDGKLFKEISIAPEAMPFIQAEFIKRVRESYPPSIELVKRCVDEKGEAKIDEQDIVNHMLTACIAIARNQPVSLGLDDPALIRHLPPLPESTRPLVLFTNDLPAVKGLALDGKYVITKASCISSAQSITLNHNGKPIPLSLTATNAAWDLALLELESEQSLPVIQWPETDHPPQAGDLLYAQGPDGLPVWNVATDQPRGVSKERSIGPVPDPSIISKHRAPYPLAIRHALPLDAKDAGTPVFDQEGTFVGMHIARYSRTLGLIIPAAQLKETTLQMKPPAER